MGGGGVAHILNWLVNRRPAKYIYIWWIGASTGQHFEDRSLVFRTITRWILFRNRSAFPWTTWVTTSRTRSSVISNRRCHHVLHRHHQQHHYRSFHLQILRVQHQGWDPRPSLPRRVRISYRGHAENMMAGIVLTGGSIILISCYKYHIMLMGGNIILISCWK